MLNFILFIRINTNDIMLLGSAKNKKEATSKGLNKIELSYLNIFVMKLTVLFFP